MMTLPLFIILKSLLKVYKVFVSPVLGPRCRFFPSCSEYASESLSFHGVLKGSLLAFKRILKCHPWGEAGYDPVPSCLEESHNEFLKNFNLKL